MSLPPVVRAKTPTKAGSDRQSLPPLTGLQSPWAGWLPWAAAAAALVLGFGLGILVMRHRHDSQEVVAAVNGRVIDKSMLFERLQAAAGQQVMRAMVQEELQMQFAKKMGAAPTDAEVDARYQKLSQDPKFLPTLAATGLSAEDYKRSLRVKMSQADVLAKGISVTDAEVKDFYKTQSDPRNPKGEFYKPDVMRIRVIACATQQAAQHALQDLNANTPFELAASEYSIDPASKNNGGLVAPIVRGRSPLSQAPNHLEDTLFSLKVGQIYGPASFSKAWWIVRCEDKTPGQPLPFETVKDDAVLGAKIVKGTKLNGRTIQTKFQEFWHSANLQAFWGQYQHAVTGR